MGGIADVGMAAADNRMNRELMLEISYVKIVLRKMLNNCEDVDIEPIQAPLVRELLNEDIIPPRLHDFMSSVIIARDGNDFKPVFQPNDMNKLENVGCTRKEIESKVEEAVRDVLSNSDIDLSYSTNLMDAGLDSLSVVELSQSLRSDFRIELSATVVFSAPSIEDLSNHIENILSTREVEKNNNNLSKQSVSGMMNEIGIVGMSCRFPGSVVNCESYWKMLNEGDHVSTSIPFDRWDSDSLLAAQSDMTDTEKMCASQGAFVDEIEAFDPSFFKISKAEAAAMSPQQRILLECSYLAFQDAGYNMEGMKGLNCGVFVGMTTNVVQSNVTNRSVYDATSNAASIATGRISFCFDLKGPCTAYDTACSSSLVALNAAVLSLRAGECDLALVAGVNVLFDAQGFINCALAGMLSPSGRCHTWDASADGYLRGEGCGAIILKPSDISSPDRIYSSILGTCVASDGKSATITAPNGSAQERLIYTALETAGIEPNEVDYIEAHGTGTSLGDPIEIDALSSVFGNSREDIYPLSVGSVKSSIGHLECAAGMAGLIKAILVLMHERVPSNVGLKTLNPLIERTVKTHKFPVKFPTECEPLRATSSKTGDESLIASVSSFGYAGTIAHVIIRQALKQI